MVASSPVDFWRNGNSPSGIGIHWRSLCLPTSPRRFGASADWSGFRHRFSRPILSREGPSSPARGDIIRLRRFAARFALLLAMLVSTLGHAGMVSLASTGSDPDDAYLTSTGSGSFSFETTSTTPGMAELSAFQFSLTVVSTDAGLKWIDTLNYNLTDLASFSVTLSSVWQPRVLAFQAGYQLPPDQFLATEFLVVNFFRSGGWSITSTRATTRITAQSRRRSPSWSQRRLPSSGSPWVWLASSRIVAG